MPSFGTLKADTLTHSTAGSLATNFVVEGSAKATAGVTLASGTPILNQSSNVSSLTDTDTGKVTYNFTNSFVDSGYSSIGCTNATEGVRTVTTASESSSSVRSVNSTTSSTNDNDVSAIVHGDLA